VKLASLKTGAPDGALLVASRDLRYAVRADSIAATLLQALERWADVQSALQDVYDDLNAGRAQGALELDTRRLLAPLPRAPQWLDGSAFHSHGDLMQKVFGLPPIEDKLEVPLMYQGASDDFLGPCEDMPLPSEGHAIDFEAELAVVTDRVSMGTPAVAAFRRIKLLMLINDASLRLLAPREMKTGFGFVQAKPATSFAPVAVTPDELGESWRDARVHLPVCVEWNGRWFGNPEGGQMGFGFDELIAHAARTRNLTAGTIIGSGTISNRECRTVGSACIAERRAIEMEDEGRASTPFMSFGDRVRIEVRDRTGASIFGAIDQRMVQAPSP
jgi:fumarylacetoacetate (FAA) hydrolase